MGELLSRFSIKIIHCPKFLKLSPFRINIWMTAFVNGLTLGEGGELGDAGNALVEVSAFIVTINCSFNAS